MTNTYFGAGIEPVEYLDNLRGIARFTADMVPEGSLHAAFVRSTEASARLVEVNTEYAKQLPGVIAVLSGAEIVGSRLKPRVDRGQADARFSVDCEWSAQPISVPAMAVDVVQYVGQAIAVVIATSRYEAEDAIEAVEVQYDSLKAMVDPLESLESGAPLVNPGAESNLAASISIERGERDASLGSPTTVTIEHTFRIARQSATPMECRGVVAVPRDNEVDVWMSSQSPFIIERVIQEAAGWEEGAVHVTTPAMGGAFGQKTNAFGEELVVTVLAREYGKPIAWIEDRYENLVSAPHARDQIHDARLVVDDEGRILSWEDDFIVDFGAQCFIRAGVMGNTAIHLLGPYAIPYVRIQGRGAFTNKTPTAQYRGAGRPEAAFALERSLDLAARELGIGTAKIRERNLLGPDDLPHAKPVIYRDGASIVYDGRDYQAVARAALALLPDSEIAELKQQVGPTERVGVGLAAFVEATGRGPEPDTVRVSFDQDNVLTVYTGGAPSGQAHRTTLAQIAADQAQMPMEQVKVITGATSKVPRATPTAASRTAVVTGNATRNGVVELLSVLEAWLEGLHELGSVSHVAGGFEVDGRDGVVSWRDVATWLKEGRGPAGSSQIDVIGSFAPEASTWSMAVHVAAVSVDVELGSTRVLRYAIAEETGPSINPRVVEGQVFGGVAQGIGEALLEEVTYDANGQPTATTLMDYMIPTVEDVPSVRLAHLEVKSERNPLGVKGVGESGIIGGAAVVAAAIEDALSDRKITIDRVPISSDYLLGCLMEG